jgi:hypothetical protein
MLFYLVEDFLKRALHNLSSFPKRLESSNKLKEEFEKFALDMQSFLFFLYFLYLCVLFYLYIYIF